MESIFNGMMSIVCAYALCLYAKYWLKRTFLPAPLEVRARVMRATIDERGITFSEAAYCRSIEEAEALIEELRQKYPFNNDFYYEREGDGRTTKDRAQKRARR